MLRSTHLSSIEAQLNEAIDRSEACVDFEKPDQVTQDLLTAACEASRNEIDEYCGIFGENLAVLSNSSRRNFANEHLSSEDTMNEHGDGQKVESKGVQNPVVVASISTGKSEKSSVKVDTTSEDEMLKDAKSRSAAIWKSWVDVRATATKGERHVKPITFAQAYENVKLLEAASNPIESCANQLSNLAMKPAMDSQLFPPQPMQLVPTMLSKKARTSLSMNQAMPDLTQHGLLMPRTSTCTPVRRLQPAEPLMDEIGSMSGSFCGSLRSQEVLTAAIQPQPAHMETTPVIGCLEKEPTNEKRT